MARIGIRQFQPVESIRPDLHQQERSTHLFRSEERAGTTRSIAWRVAHEGARLGRDLNLSRTARRGVLWRVARLADLIRREGFMAVPTRLWMRATRQLIRFILEPRGSSASWTIDERPVFVLVHHGGGGGIERHIRDLNAGLLREGVRPVLLSPDPGGRLCWEERDADWRETWRLMSGAAPTSMSEVLNRLDPAHVHVHSLMGIPPEFLAVVTWRGLRYDWTIHDYFPVCPRAHLDRDDGRYCGEPNESGCESCLSRRGDYRGRPLRESIGEWRGRFAGYLNDARRVFAPSEDTARRIERYAPRAPVVHRPHAEPASRGFPARVPFEPGSVVRVALLGTLTSLKGASLVEACAWDARKNRRSLEFVVVGRTDRDAALARTRRVTLTGPFREAEVYERLRRAACHVALLPSVVPETYMYTLSIVIRAGLFPVCLDLGAQAERVRHWRFGLVLPRDASPAAINEALIEAAAAHADAPSPDGSEARAGSADLLGSYYGFTEDDRDRLGLPSRDSSGFTPESLLT